MAAAGQDEDASTGVASNDEIIVDTVVVGQKSKSEMRRDVFQAEEDFYSVYNKLNDDKEYDVRCFYEKRTGTNIKNHVCRARFVTKAYSVHARRNRNNLELGHRQNSADLARDQTLARQSGQPHRLLVDLEDALLGHAGE